MGLIITNLHLHVGYLGFPASDAWLYSLYKRRNFVWRTTSRPVLTEALWIEIRTLFLHNICTLVQIYNIPDELIINIDQTPSKYVPISNVTMTEKNSKHVRKQGADDKRAITLTLAETLSGDMLPFQMIYTSKTSHYQLPNFLRASYEDLINCIGAMKKKPCVSWKKSFLHISLR